MGKVINIENAIIIAYDVKRINAMCVTKGNTITQASYVQHEN